MKPSTNVLVFTFTLFVTQFAPLAKAYDGPWPAALDVFPDCAKRTIDPLTSNCFNKDDPTDADIACYCNDATLIMSSSLGIYETCTKADKDVTYKAYQTLCKPYV